MAVVVEQTLPFPQHTLDLTSPTRWNTLLPLIRPSIRSIQTSKNHTLLLDTSPKTSPSLHTIAISSAGNFSSKLLDPSHSVTGILTEPSGGAGLLSATDLPHTLRSAGVDPDPGIVVVRSGKTRNLEVHEPGLIELTANGELEADHVLHLLASASPTTRANPHLTAELLKAWFAGARKSHSTFHHEKAEGNPAVLHAAGASAFGNCKEAVARDLNAVLKEAKGQSEDVVYSVHVSDVNGLSRLENYIVAGEIAKFLDAQKVPYTLSHSTILNHTALARGFSLSIAPIPSSLLSAGAKPQPHTPIGATTTSTESSSSTTTSHPSFNDATIRSRIESGCRAVIDAEPTITEYDTIVGDGDCGYTLRDGAQKVLAHIEGKDLSDLASVVSSLVSELEITMGGTSGALYCIYLSALSNSLVSTNGDVPKALQGALEQLCKYTRARVGDRTMMDALIPFVETLEGTGDLKASVEKAREGVEGTKKMVASLGRSTYLDEKATRGVPDPGAYGLLVLFEGMAK